MRHNQEKNLIPEYACQAGSKDALKQQALSLEEDYWHQCKKYLQDHIPAFFYNNIIEPLQAKSRPTLNSMKLELIAPDRQIALRVTQRYLPMIQKFLLSTPLQGQVGIFVGKNQRPYQKQKLNKPEIAKAPDPAPLTGGPVFISENFCIPVMNCNQLEQLWQTSGNLSYICGTEGSGKTTIGNALVQHEGMAGKRARLLKFGVFLAELAAASRSRDSTSWRKRLRDYNCLVIDDFQYIKPQALRSQEELIYLVDEFLQNGKSLVFCADRSALQLRLTPPLLSRLQAARIIQLGYPDQKQRESILQKEGRLCGLELKPEFISYLGRCISRDMRRLKSSVKRLKDIYSYGFLQGSPVEMDIPLLDRLCQDLYTYQNKVEPTDILAAVAKFYNVPPQAITGPARDKKYAQARHLAAYLCTHYLRMGLKETAQLIGRRDHASVIYARNKITKLMQTDLFFRRQVQELFFTLQT